MTTAPMQTERTGAQPPQNTCFPRATRRRHRGKPSKEKKAGLTRASWTFGDGKGGREGGEVKGWVKVKGWVTHLPLSGTHRFFEIPLPTRQSPFSIILFSASAPFPSSLRPVPSRPIAQSPHKYWRSRHFQPSFPHYMLQNYAALLPADRMQSVFPVTAITPSRFHPAMHWNSRPLTRRPLRKHAFDVSTTTVLGSFPSQYPPRHPLSLSFTGASREWRLGLGCEPALPQSPPGTSKMKGKNLIRLNDHQRQNSKKSKKEVKHRKSLIGHAVRQPFGLEG